MVMTLIDARPAIMATYAAVSRDTGTRIGLDQVDSRLGAQGWRSTAALKVWSMLNGTDACMCVSCHRPSVLRRP
jgi:hypothetical protein